MNAYEREEQDIERRYARGEITNAQMWVELRELQRDARAGAEERAREAYEREREIW